MVLRSGLETNFIFGFTPIRGESKGKKEGEAVVQKTDERAVGEAQTLTMVPFKSRTDLSFKQKVNQPKETTIAESKSNNGCSTRRKH